VSTLLATEVLNIFLKTKTKTLGRT